MTEDQKIDYAVDRFASKMKAKMLGKRDCGWSGWRTKKFMTRTGGWEAAFRSHVNGLLAGDGTQAVDVANYLMFYDNYHSKGTVSLVDAELLEACKLAHQNLVGSDGSDWQIAQLTLQEAIAKAAKRQP